MASFSTFGSIANRKGRRGVVIPTLPYQVSGGGYPGNGIIDISINKTNGDNPGSLHTIFFKNPATANYTFSTTADLSASILIVSGGGGGGANRGSIGSYGGGGGGGNVVVYDSCGGKITNITKESTFSISVGAGGAGGIYNSTLPTKGSVSSLNALTGKILSSTGTILCDSSTILNAPNNGTTPSNSISGTISGTQSLGQSGAGAGGGGGTGPYNLSGYGNAVTVNARSGGVGSIGGNGGGTLVNSRAAWTSASGDGGSGGGGGPGGMPGLNGRLNASNTLSLGRGGTGTFCTFMNTYYGNGGNSYATAVVSGTPNTGNGGNGGFTSIPYPGSDGGSGVVIIQITIPQPA